jgi:hypothetical protein
MPYVEARRRLDLQDFRDSRDTENGFPPPPIGPGPAMPPEVREQIEKNFRRAEYYRQWRAGRKAQAAALGAK